MTSLSTLLVNRAALQNRGVEQIKNGNVWSFSYEDAFNSGRCQFCWIAPATGTAVVEIWGAQGSGSMECCCAGGGIPGNSGAYSKKTVCVTGGTSYVCGWVGCAPYGSPICYVGQSGCSIACFFNTSNNVILCASGGYGGYNMCTTSTASWCCYSNYGYCSTLLATYCGIICNFGASATTTPCAVTAGGGDVNISGGISCVNILECCNYYPHCYEYTLAIAPGIFSSTSPTCVRFVRQPNIYNATQFASTGRCELQHALAAITHAGIPIGDICWTLGSQDCGCYEWSGCQYGVHGVPGLPGFPCSNVRAMGMRGGHGHVKITLY